MEFFHAVSAFWQVTIAIAIGVSAIIGAAYQIAKAFKSVAASASDSFGKAVTEHVKPLVDEMKTGLIEVSTTLRSIQSEHRAATDHFAEDRRVKQEAIDENTERIDGHDKDLAKHGERIARVEGALDIEAPTDDD